MRALCPAAAIPPGGTAGFPPADPDREVGLFAVHHFRDGIFVYLNLCPHLGVPLDWQPGKFLGIDGTHIVCATHGAEFRITDGVCLRGPCRGDALTKVPSTVEDGMLMVPPTAGRMPGQGLSRPYGGQTE